MWGARRVEYALRRWELISKALQFLIRCLEISAAVAANLRWHNIPPRTHHAEAYYAGLHVQSVSDLEMDRSGGHASEEGDPSLLAPPADHHVQSPKRVDSTESKHFPPDGSSSLGNRTFLWW